MIQQTPDTVEEGLWQGWHEEQRSKNVFREGKKRVPLKKMGSHLYMTRLWFAFPDLFSQWGERQISTKAHLPASV